MRILGCGSDEDALEEVHQISDWRETMNDPYDKPKEKNSIKYGGVGGTFYSLQSLFQ